MVKVVHFVMCTVAQSTKLGLVSFVPHFSGREEKAQDLSLPRRPGPYCQSRGSTHLTGDWSSWRRGVAWGPGCCRKLSEAGRPARFRAHISTYLPTHLSLSLPTYLPIHPSMHPPIHASIHPPFSIQHIGPKSVGKTSLKLLREEIVLKTCPSQPPLLSAHAHSAVPV